jgi:uncharacterized protein DUF4386
MMERVAKASPLFKARMAGFFYLLVFVIGIPAIVARRGIVVKEDAAATAAQLLAHESLFRLGVAGDLLIIASYVVVTALLYGLFKPVSRSVSLVAAFFSLMGCAIQASACAFELAPFVVLGGGQGLSGLKAEQLQALGYMSLSLYGPAYKIGLVFFGFYCLLIGCLILRSTFIPRIVGALMVIAGLAWLTFLTPFGKDLAPFAMAPAALGELVLTVWLLVKGVDVERWEEQARNAQRSSFGDRATAG